MELGAWGLIRFRKMNGDRKMETGDRKMETGERKTENEEGKKCDLKIWKFEDLKMAMNDVCF
jgi:hypothetical protein